MAKTNPHRNRTLVQKLVETGFLSMTWLALVSIAYYIYSFILKISTGLGSSVGIVSAPRSGGTGFDPGPRHTKVVNNGTSSSPLGTRIFGVGLGLVAPVSV